MKTLCKRLVQPIAALVLVVLMQAHVAAADSVWPQWRGLYGTGHSDETNLPVR